MEGEVVSSYNENPFLNTLVYDVQFPDGEIKEYVANVIAENIYSQVIARATGTSQWRT